MKKQKIKTGTEVAVATLAVLAVAALVNYLSNSFFHRIDLTENRQYTVSDATRRILKNLDDIIVVKAFFSKDLPPETNTTVNTVRDMLNEYKNIAGGKLRVTWEDPAGNQEAVNSAQSLGVPEITLQTFKRDKAESMKGYMGIGIMHGDKRESIPVVQNLQNLEYDLTMAIMKVKRSSIPKIGVLKCQSADIVPDQVRERMGMGGETTDKKFAPLFQIFRGLYEVVTVDLSEGKPIDSDIRTLIIPGGDNFSERAVFEIDQYFMNGGNIIALANGVAVSFRQGFPQGSALETPFLELLEHYGVRVERNLVMDASCGRVQVPRNLGMFTINELLPYPYFVRVFENGFAPDNPAVSSLTDLVLGWASSLTRAEDTLGRHNVTSKLLVSSSEQSWTVTEFLDLMPQQEQGYAVPARDLMKHHALAMHLNGDFKSYFDGKPIPSVREKSEEDEDSGDNLSKINLLGDDKDRTVKPSNTNGNLVVVGDANFISAQNASAQNAAFMMNLVDWLSLDDNLIAVRSRTVRDKTIDPNILTEGSTRPAMIRWINLLLMPVVVAIAGIVISLRRREKAAPAAASATKAVPAPVRADGYDNSRSKPVPKPVQAESTSANNTADDAGAAGGDGDMKEGSDNA